MGVGLLNRSVLNSDSKWNHQEDLNKTKYQTKTMMIRQTLKHSGLVCSESGPQHQDFL